MSTPTHHYSISLEKEELIFSAAHFITFHQNICERIHGHNYRVKCDVSGPLDENEYVIDFIALRDTLKKISTELDHHVLLPTQHPLIKVTEEGEEVTAVFENRRWVFPREDCVLLPVMNTTAELLAQYIGNRLLEQLSHLHQFRPHRLTIGVDENEGQWAYCQFDLS